MMFALPTELLLEGLVAILLGATVFYCALLDKRLRNLRSGQDDLRQIIQDLDRATGNARASIEGLRAASEDAGRDLGERLVRARALADELGLMLEAGDRIADKLSGSVTRTTQAAPMVSAADVADASARDESVDGAAKSVPRDRRESEERLLNALRRAR